MPNILITGCASGIGLHLAHALLQRGYSVVATDIEADQLATAFQHATMPEGVQVMLERLDVTNPEAWRQVVQKITQQWGRLDVVINNAGVLYTAFSADYTDRQINQLLDVNVKGVIYGTRAASGIMVQQGAGHIINIASLAGVAPIAGLALYSASKFAVRGYTLAVAQELAESGVGVTCICPDVVQTPMFESMYHERHAALAFSGNKVLTVRELEACIVKVLRRRPLEALVPTARGFTAKLVSAFPGLIMPVRKKLLAKGRRKQQAIQQKGNKKG